MTASVTSLQFDLDGAGVSSSHIEHYDYRTIVSPFICLSTAKEMRVIWSAM